MAVYKIEVVCAKCGDVYEGEIVTDGECEEKCGELRRNYFAYVQQTGLLPKAIIEECLACSPGKMKKVHLPALCPRLQDHPMAEEACLMRRGKMTAEQFEAREKIKKKLGEL